MNTLLNKVCFATFIFIQCKLSVGIQSILSLCRWTNGKWPTSVQALRLAAENTNLFVPIGTPLCLSVRSTE